MHIVDRCVSWEILQALQIQYMDLEVEVEVEFTIAGESVSLAWCRAPIWSP
jgi:hypothetical protein